MNNIISLKNISKYYHIYDKPIERLKELFSKGKKSFHKKIWALKDISFDIKKGEVLGIIGMNGAGKTTLLQVLSKILTPSDGAIAIHGNVLSLIELGSGINYDFTGRENIIQYGLVLGQKKQYLEQNIENAIEFADIGSFIDQPVKTYSSGMIMRLAFSVLTICKPDILLIDEVVSVGDINFRMKCFNWLDKFIANGGTVCIASHDINLIANKCDRVLFLDHGKIAKLDKPLEVIQHFKHESLKYLSYSKLEVSKSKKSTSKKGVIPKKTPRKGSAKALITRLLINDKEISSEIILSQDSPIKIEIEAVFFKDLKNYSFCFALMSQNGIDIFSISSALTPVKHPELILNEPILCSMTINHNLQPGEYYIKPAITDVPGKTTVELIDVFEIYTKVIIRGQCDTYGFVDFPYFIEFPQQTETSKTS